LFGEDRPLARAFAKTDWLLAEMKGAGLAMVSAGLGVIAKIGAERFEEGEKDDGPMGSS